MNGLTCGSLFSGVGGMDLGIVWAGYEHRFFAEIDPFARAVLAERFPGVTIYEDVRDVGADAGYVDLLAGGFPCQDLSVAGKRKGLAGERSGLFHEFVRVADALRPRALLLENVEGLYSSNGGRDFGVVLDTLAERGYLATWRTLDAQHFGVPQRRRRVFVCAIAGDDPRAERIGEVLALAEGSLGDSPTREPSWPLAALRAGAGAPGGGGGDSVMRERERESFPPSRPSGRRDRADLRATSARTSSGRVVGCLTATYGEQSGQDFGPSGAGLVLPSDLPRRERERERERERSAGRERPHGEHPERGGREERSGGTPDRGRGYGVNPGNDEIAGALVGNAQGGQRTTDLAGAYVAHAVVRFSHTQGLDPQAAENITPTLRKNGGGAASVRRLTPLECERLMGWPDGWTDVPWNGKDHAPDSRRYAACGNGVVAPVAFWIAARLAEVLGDD